MKHIFTILIISLLSFPFSSVVGSNGPEWGNRFSGSASPDNTAVLEAPYPNPASSYAFIKYELPGYHFNGELRVYSLIGQEVKVIPLDQAFGEVEIPTLELKSGMYFVYMVVGGEKVTSRKMIVSH